jgi:hypothetical protein
MLRLDLKLGPQVDACLSGSLPVELTFRDNGPSVGQSRSAAKNIVSSKPPAKSKGKMKAGPSARAYAPLFEDDDEADPVSDFEPIKDVADIGPTITVEPQDHNQARLAAMLAVREQVRALLWKQSHWQMYVQSFQRNMAFLKMMCSPPKRSISFH